MTVWRSIFLGADIQAAEGRRQTAEGYRLGVQGRIPKFIFLFQYQYINPKLALNIQILVEGPAKKRRDFTSNPI
jgi:hypothetical protein